MITQSSRPRKKTLSLPEKENSASPTLIEELTEVNVGANLRAIRNQQGLSIRALAELSGLNVNTLSMIENNKTSPSVSTLQRLATALRGPITAFFEFGREPRSIVFQRAGLRQRVMIEQGSLANLGGGLSLHGGIPYKILGLIFFRLAIIITLTFW